MSLVKLQDSFNDRSSAADIYWSEMNFRAFYRKFRNEVDVPKNFLKSSNADEKIIKLFQLRGFQFGNWLTNEDRFNYLAAFYICLYDLQKVMKFKNNNIGLSGLLGIAIGSRGVPGAAAHFEPNKHVINISRYRREDVMIKAFKDANLPAPYEIPKHIRFFETGGIGAFAHEYGHFLDLCFGRYVEPIRGSAFLTGPNSVSSKKIEYSSKQPIRRLVEDILQDLWFVNGEKSAYNKRLIETDSKYLRNRQEIFARTFEQYVQFKLIEILGIKNKFMTETKYNEVYYLKDKELRRVIPKMDKLVIMFRKHI